MDELVSLNKIWETDNLGVEKEDEHQTTSDIEIIETEQNEGKEVTNDDIILSSDEYNLNDEEIINKLKNLHESQDLTQMNEEDLNDKVADIKRQLSQDVEDEETVEETIPKSASTNFDVDKIKELTAFVSNCATVDDLEDKSSTEDDEEEEDEEEEDEGGGMIYLAANVNVNSRSKPYKRSGRHFNIISSSLYSYNFSNTSCKYNFIVNIVSLISYPI